MRIIRIIAAPNSRNPATRTRITLSISPSQELDGRYRRSRAERLETKRGSVLSLSKAASTFISISRHDRSRTAASDIGKHRRRFQGQYARASAMYFSEHSQSSKGEGLRLSRENQLQSQFFPRDLQIDASGRSTTELQVHTRARPTRNLRGSRRDSIAANSVPSPSGP